MGITTILAMEQSGVPEPDGVGVYIVDGAARRFRLTVRKVARGGVYAECTSWTKPEGADEICR